VAFSRVTQGLACGAHYDAELHDATGEKQRR
jgi:hypothetical protein